MEDEQPLGPPLRTRLVFRFSWACRSDEEVRVVGSCLELGHWQPSSAHTLTRSSDDSRYWYSKPGVLVPLGRRVEYKYVLCSSSGDLLEWEQWEGNRVATPTGLRHIVEDDNGALRMVEEAEQDKDVASPMVLQGLRDKAALASPIPWSRQPSCTNETMTRKLSRSDLPPSGNDISDAEPRFSSPSMAAKNKPENGGSPDTIVLPGLRRNITAATEPTSVGNVELTEDDTVMMVWRQLPLSVEKEESGNWRVVTPLTNESGAAPFLFHLTQSEGRQNINYQVFFVGLPGVHVDNEEDKKKIREVLRARFCIPVFVDKELADDHLEFSQAFMWPVFHNTKIFAGQTQAYDEAKWKRYLALNNAFAFAIEESRSPSTLVWVHDYHLVMVPRYVFRRIQDCPLGLFLHCAFPSSEVFNCLPNREEILTGMLLSKVVCFQVFDYLRNFISCCQLLLGARHTFHKGGIMCIEHENRSVVINADHFVIPYKHLLRKIDSDEVRKEAKSIREKFKGKTIIGSFDRCDRFAGLLLKFRLFHQFLSEYVYYRGKVVLVQYVNKASFSNQEATTIVEGLKRMAEETNKAFPQPPGHPEVVNIIVEETGGRSHRLATLQAMDILFDTSINDGLNLIPFMFLAAHGEDRQGRALVSEFCGCTRALTGIYKINPFNPNATMNALDSAMNMTDQALRERFEKDYSYVSSQVLTKWLENNVSEIKRVRESGASFQVAGFGASFGRNQKGGFCPLDSSKLVEEYRKAKTRVLFFDVEGTLATKASFRQTAGSVALLKEGVPPSEKILDCLQTLANDRGNTVMVISGRDPTCLERWFGNVPLLGLCAEHGFHWTYPGKLQPKGVDFAPCPFIGEGTQKNWYSMDPSGEMDKEWKMLVVEIMKLYVKRVRGSILEQKSSGISWNYRGVGAQSLISEVAMELARFLDPSDPQGVLNGYPVKVVCGKGYVEVKRIDVDKGVTAVNMLREMQQQIAQPVDFVLCIGDDRSDEDMFSAVSKFFSADAPSGDAPVKRNSISGTPLLSDRRASNSSRGHLSDTEHSPREQRHASMSSLRPVVDPPACKYFTVTVGRKPSMAKYFVKDVDEVSALLDKLASQTVVSSFSRYSSMPQLHEMVAHDDEDDLDLI